MEAENRMEWDGDRAVEWKEGRQSRAGHSTNIHHESSPCEWGRMRETTSDVLWMAMQ